MTRQMEAFWVWFLLIVVHQLNVVSLCQCFHVSRRCSILNETNFFYWSKVHGTTTTRRSLRGVDSDITSTSNEQSIYTIHYEKMATEKLLSLELFREMNVQNQTKEKKEIEEINHHIMHTKIKKRKDASKSSRKRRMLNLLQNVSEQNRKFAQNELW